MQKMMIALTAAAVALPPVSAPALAQHHQSRQSHRHANQRDRIHNWQRSRSYDWNRYEPGYNAYYADRYYRPGNYAERRLGRNDRIYRGRDGRYYCRRSDGTTGLIVGAAIGGILGSRVAVGGSTTLGALLGGGIGAILGQQIARGSVRCR
jgi:hypothetical protein